MLKNIFILISIIWISSAYAGDSQDVYQYPESSVWVKTLNYQLAKQNIYVGQERVGDEVDDSEKWHLEKKAFLETAYKIMRGPNVAVGRIGIIYSKPNSDTLYVNYYDLPYLYLSGWSETNLLPRPKNALQNLARNNNYLDIRLLAEASRFKAANADYEYASHLKNIFHQTLYTNSGEEKDLRENVHQVLKARLYQTHALLEQLRDKTYLRSAEGKTHLASRFYDTEQAIFLEILRTIETLSVRSTLLEKVPEKSTLHLFTLDIASYLDMCFDCSDTAFCQTNSVSGFASSVQNLLWDLNGQFSQSNHFKLFIKVSSQYPCVSDDPQRWESRGSQTNFNETYKLDHTEDYTIIPLLNPKKFGSHIAQLNVGQ